MRNKKIFVIILFLSAFLLFSSGNTQAICVGTPANLFTMVNWGSVFPVVVAGITVFPSIDRVNTFDLAQFPIYLCPLPFPPWTRPGIPVAFWEPARYVETVKDPGCFPSLGFSIGGLSAIGAGSTKGGSEDGIESTFAQAHWFIFPIWAMLELLTDLVCVEHSGFDPAYLTELDPLWNNDSLSAYINPEALLFGNPVAQMACIADSISSTFGYSLAPLFWCMGSWGSAYPMTGTISEGKLTAANAGIAARMLYKLSRELLICDTNIDMCMCVHTPIWVKQNWKIHTSWPVKDFWGHPIGRSSMLWDTFKAPVFFSEGNFVWMVYRRRGCCVL